MVDLVALKAKIHIMVLFKRNVERYSAILDYLEIYFILIEQVKKGG
jgi:hypothetical protein